MNDNVKKVFEMLGVEPNERFKIDNVNLKNHIYFIDERLSVFDEKLNDLDVFLRDLLNGTYKIIKLPKEPKKKKLRDLAPEEWDKWSEKNCGDCLECIFRKVLCSDSRKEESWINNKQLYNDAFLNKEIEVEE